SRAMSASARKEKRGCNTALKTKGTKQYILPSDAQAGKAPSSDGEKAPRKSAATELIEFASEFAFFHDPQDRPFVRLEINSHVEVWRVESSKFRKLLAREYYQRAHK